jgi:hypothetical protein
VLEEAHFVMLITAPRPGYGHDKTGLAAIGLNQTIGTTFDPSEFLAQQLIP